MKSIKYITLGALTVLGIFCAILYSSCSKDECGAVTCLNKGECKGGVCKCTKGIFGANCEIIYRDRYKGTYKGLPPNEPYSDTTNLLIFNPTADTTNYNTMDVIWVDTHGTAKLILPIELQEHFSGGSTFAVIPLTIGSVTFTGNGTVNGNMASMQIMQKDTSGATGFWTFNNYLKQ